MKSNKRCAYDGSQQRIRALKAAMILAIAMMLVCRADMTNVVGKGVAGMHTAITAAHYVLASNDADEASSLADDAQEMVFDLFESCAGSICFEEGSLPEGFEKELFDPKSVGCNWTTCSELTVALYFDIPIEQAKAKVDKQMIESGWIEVAEASSDYCNTYVKGAGRYRWAYVTSNRVSSTSVITFSLQEQAEGQ